MEQCSGPPLYPSISSIVPPGRRSRSMPRHLLHGGQVDAEVEQVSDPGPAQVVGSGGRDLGLEAALATDSQACGGAEAGQLTGLTLEAARLEHGAEERARLRTADLDPVLDGGEG